jgi:integrase
LGFRHAENISCRAAEVVDLRWEQVDFKTASLHIRRAKNGTAATHSLSGREMRELRRHQRESPPSPFVFVSERGAPLSAPGFSRIVERAADVADLGIKAHAHMLRHACGYANDGHDSGRSRLISGIATSRIRRGIRRWRRSGSRNSFGIDPRGSSHALVSNLPTPVYERTPGENCNYEIGAVLP